MKPNKKSIKIPKTRKLSTKVSTGKSMKKSQSIKLSAKAKKGFIDPAKIIKTSSPIDPAEKIKGSNLSKEIYKSVKENADFYDHYNSYNPESVRHGGAPGSAGKLPTQRLSNLLGSAIPKSRIGITVKAQEFFEEDDLLNSKIQFLTDLTIAGFSMQAMDTRVKANNEINTEGTEYQDMMEEYADSIGASEIIEELAQDWFVTDNMILYWRMRIDGSDSVDTNVLNDNVSKEYAPKDEYGIPGLIEICVLNPSEVNWDNSAGNNILMLDIPQEVRVEIQAKVEFMRQAKKKDAEILRLMKEDGYPEKWVIAVINGDTQVELREDDGDYWIIKSRNRRYRGLANPSMKSIFLALLERNLITEGEFSAAWMFCNFLMLLKQGESITAGINSGSTKNWLKPDEAEKLKEMFTTYAKASRVAVNHTTKIEFIIPPKEMFDPVRYDSCDKKISRWTGVAEVLSTGQGSTYGGGYMALKPGVAKIEKCRSKITEVMYEFYNHQTIKDSVHPPEGMYCTCVFDTNVLKEARQLLDELKFMLPAGIIDPRSAALELGRNPDRYKASKIRSAEEERVTKAWSPVFEASMFGNQDRTQDQQGDGEGRPANPDTTVSDETRNQPPSGSRNAND